MRWWWLLPDWLRVSLSNDTGNSLIVALIVLFLLVYFHRRAKRYPTSTGATWSMLIEGLQMSPKDFYTLLASAIEKRQVPGGEQTRIEWPEGNVFSPKREYFRIRRKRLVFDVCAAPFGTGFFVSWWQGETKSVFFFLLHKVPWIGPPLVNYLNPDTYYKIDTANMFHTAIHEAVLETVNQVSEARGLRRLTDAESKPLLKDFFRR